VPALTDTVAGNDDVAGPPLDSRRLRKRLDEDVDLAAARQAHAPRFVVRDPVGDEFRCRVREDDFGALADVSLDAAARD